MGVEIDYMAVGNGDYCGDAIALRYGNLHGRREEQTIFVIDGGTKDSGKELVELVRKHYKTNHVDHVVSTHPDRDHASGASVVLEELSAGYLWMHTPWDNCDEIKHLFSDGRVTASSLKQTLKDGLEAAYKLEELAKKKGVKITEPFQGVHLGETVRVLGPERNYYYTELIPNFSCTPEPIKQPSYDSFLQKSLAEAKKAVQKFFSETLGFDSERLTDEGQTSPPNNSSAILLFRVDTWSGLFTGDAGMPALAAAIDYADSIGVSLQSLDFFDVPHHGSDHNLGPTVLKKIRAKTAFVSAAPDGDPKHPSRKVINALIRRNFKPYVTKGVPLQIGQNAPAREGYTAATPISFFNQVEE